MRISFKWEGSVSYADIIGTISLILAIAAFFV